MNVVLRESLERGARSIETPEPDLDAVVARGEQRLRRRRLGAIGGTALAVALVIAAPAVVTAFRDEPQMVDRPGPLDPDVNPGTRPLVYLQDGELHVGSRTLDLSAHPVYGSVDGLRPNALAGLWVTDDGAVYATLDGRLWFTDGRTREQIGFVSGSQFFQEPGGGVTWTARAGRPRSWVATDPVGSHVTWIEYPGKERAEAVVYDTSKRRVRVRLPLPLPRGRALDSWQVFGDQLYWRDKLAGSSGPGGELVRTSLTTRVTEPATDAMIAQERRRMGRTLLVGSGQDQQVVMRAEHNSFVVRDSRLEAVRFEGQGAVLDGDVLREYDVVPLIDPATGERLRFRAPASLEQVDGLVLFQWLDDDRFVLTTAPGWRPQRRDIVVCRLSTEKCEVTERIGPGPGLGRGSAQWLVLPDMEHPG